ncbi:aminoglycoside phosphotransferase family protein [Rummeliibacillus pycnus]|uniref:aminoglycoside phosphotransferase family protein n=1 Tax=Rummeliibacillus pycnus TaxID=101070 RepID=UPI0037C6A527
MLNRLVNQFGLKVRSIDDVEDSHSSTVYKCDLLNGETVYIKIPYTKIKFQRELEAYKILKGNVAIPKMLDYWEGDEDCIGAFLLSKLQGKPLTSQGSPKLAFQVGVLHASMHNVNPTNGQEVEWIQNEYSNWPNFVERQFYSFAEDVKEVLDERLYKQAIKKFEEMKNQLPSPDGPSFIHMDFRPANIIVDGDQVSGVIDFESVRFGSTEIDFTKINRDFLSLDRSLYNAYKDGYNSIRPLKSLEDILPFYQFTDAFNSIGWCKRRGIKENAMFLKENLTILKRLC